MKFLSTCSLAVIVAVLFTKSHASVRTEKAECSAELQISEIISMKNPSAHAHADRPDRIKFLVTKTNCNFLATDKEYKSSSIEYRNIATILKTGDLLEGEIARNSAMGPNGVVYFAEFQSPGFSKKYEFSFSFPY